MVFIKYHDGLLSYIIHIRYPCMKDLSPRYDMIHGYTVAILEVSAKLKMVAMHNRKDAMVEWMWSGVICRGRSSSDRWCAIQPSRGLEVVAGFRRRRSPFHFIAYNNN